MNNLIDKMLGSDNFHVTSHCSPDGDSLGSSAGLCKALKKLGKEVYFVLDDKIPSNLEFVVEGIDIKSSNEVDTERPYVLVALDCGDYSRPCCSETVKKGASMFVNIDHHISNDCFGDVNYVDKKASSTSEIVYYILKTMEYEQKIDIIGKDIGTALYTGLITDTGNFMYSNVYPESFKMAYELLQKGIDKQYIVKRLFQSDSLDRIKLLADVLATLEIVEGKIAYIEVTQNMLIRNNIDNNNTEGLINYARDIENIEVGIMFKEKSPGEIKVSFRSKEIIDVNEIARKFGGGGHIRAAGCTIHDSLENAKNKVIEEVVKSFYQ
ncbi:phosphoesterase RecJ domain-containing protein [Peptoclostridium litorale DSM 5388]|uniref:Bifunctional oligoribonuclease and PAP phosphatase NrnA n=1 Tax=Peptoclostridium litorale DSM 5388 TaxID=1121324 RepID=A0A069RDR3_PEPLI|nr:bifunctional oligoribonuclease/PAP phosphatase NrnA [Peptoclostridium litorale]KDR95209.1 bifunctional oligoribonuclease and PAP phosphatase NrnA [Peptoclostridium litorale DSM 5388]SIN73356.1 phosphoesterase RecJ domain-containing protein [Peptoclostridium litorale DSM 5388]